MSQDHSDHGPGHYVKIYLILMGLFIISVIGPEIGIRWVTLVTAFGIAIVKFLIVAAYFMHLNVEKKYIHYMLWGMLLLMGTFFGGTMVDIMSTKGSNWVNQGAVSNIELNQHRLDAPADH